MKIVQNLSKIKAQTFQTVQDEKILSMRPSQDRIIQFITPNNAFNSNTLIQPSQDTIIQFITPQNDLNCHRDEMLDQQKM